MHNWFRQPPQTADLIGDFNPKLWLRASVVETYSNNLIISTKQSVKFQTIWPSSFNTAYNDVEKLFPVKAEPKPFKKNSLQLIVDVGTGKACLFWSMLWTLSLVKFFKPQNGCRRIVEDKTEESGLNPQWETAKFNADPELRGILDTVFMWAVFVC